MKILTNFALKGEHKYLQSVEIYFLKLIPELLGNLFVSFLSLYILTKKFYEADLKLK